ncbi:chromatin structure-remodeling complex protein BSH-like [Mangifera indica]|uniref:chromatin structure-remodeling complex protein BSH-like n=1 Tax=Mangifera indica TaxID=29780 RepID=UPI001CF94626|nr:chromatin structure-remodeling complex protein BSH-like [Mangifera indica]
MLWSLLLSSIFKSIVMSSRISFCGFQDWNNYESDPEDFARTFCQDLAFQDPEVGPVVAFAIREQLFEIAIHSVASAREIKMNKKGRGGGWGVVGALEHVPTSEAGGNVLDCMKLFRCNSSVVRKRKEWDVFEPVVDILSNEEVDALEARE